MAGGSGRGGLMHGGGQRKIELRSCRTDGSRRTSVTPVRRSAAPAAGGEEREAERESPARVGVIAPAALAFIGTRLSGAVAVLVDGVAGDLGRRRAHVGIGVVAV